ncbi:hypothetical protein OG528_27955 [Streptomyces platensis]
MPTTHTAPDVDAGRTTVTTPVRPASRCALHKRRQVAVPDTVAVFPA